MYNLVLIKAEFQRNYQDRRTDRFTDWCHDDRPLLVEHPFLPRIHWLSLIFRLCLHM
jgi:hypothetical protein